MSYFQFWQDELKIFIIFRQLGNSKQGYVVAWINAGIKLIFKSDDDVREPLEMPWADEVDLLQKLIDKEDLLLN